MVALTTAQADQAVTSAWVDIAAVNTALASASCILENIAVADTIIRVACGGTAAAGSGIGIKPGESMLCNSGTIFVRADSARSNTKLAISLVA